MTTSILACAKNRSGNEPCVFVLAVSDAIPPQALQAHCARHGVEYAIISQEPSGFTIVNLTEHDALVAEPQ